MTDQVIVLDSEPPRFIRPLSSIIDADALPTRDRRGQNPAFTFFDPDASAKQVGAIEFPINPQRDAELARPIRQIVIRRAFPVIASP